VELLIVGFSGTQCTATIGPELVKLVESGTISILDLVLVTKDPDGELIERRHDQLDTLVSLSAFGGLIGGLITKADIAHAASALEPNASALLLIWEDLWAAPFAEAIRLANGVVNDSARIPGPVIAPALVGRHVAV